MFDNLKLIKEPKRERRGGKGGKMRRILVFLVVAMVVFLNALLGQTEKTLTAEKTTASEETKTTPAPPAGNVLSVGKTYNFNIRVTGDEDFENIFGQLKDILKIYKFGIEGDLKFSGEYLKNKNFPRSQAVKINPGSNLLPITLPEAMILLRDNPGLLGENAVLLCGGSLYDRDAYGAKYRLNRNPAIVIDGFNRRIQFTVGAEIAGVDPDDYPVVEVSGNTPEDSPSRIVRLGQECRDGFFLIGSNTEIYSPKSRNYVVKEGLNFGIYFANNWEILFGGNWTGKNDRTSDSSFTEQSANLGIGISQTDASVEIRGQIGRYINENKTAGSYKTAGLFGVDARGKWIPNPQISFEGGVNYKIISRAAPEPRPPSSATANIEYSPFAWDVLGNGNTNNYGFGAKADVFITDGLAVENIAGYVFLGTGLISARFPEQKLGLGVNYNAQTGRFGPYVSLKFNLGVK